MSDLEQTSEQLSQASEAAAEAGLETPKTNSEVQGALATSKALVAGGHVSLSNALTGFLLALEHGLIRL